MRERSGGREEGSKGEPKEQDIGEREDWRKGWRKAKSVRNEVSELGVWSIILYLNLGS